MHCCSPTCPGVTESCGGAQCQTQLHIPPVSSEKAFIHVRDFGAKRAYGGSPRLDRHFHRNPNGNFPLNFTCSHCHTKVFWVVVCHAGWLLFINGTSFFWHSSLKIKPKLIFPGEIIPRTACPSHRITLNFWREQNVYTLLSGATIRRILELQRGGLSLLLSVASCPLKKSTIAHAAVKIWELSPRD